MHIKWKISNFPNTVKARPFWFIALSTFLLLCFIFANYYYFAVNSGTTKNVLFNNNEYFTSHGKNAIAIWLEHLVGSDIIGKSSIDLFLKDNKGKKTKLTTIVTNEYGFGIFNGTIPFDPGNYILEAFEGDRLLSSIRVTVIDNLKCIITTDKPIYQHGQTIHIRSLCKYVNNSKPASEKNIIIKLIDPKGNIIYRSNNKTSKYGISYWDIELADMLIEGNYTISLAAGNYECKKSITVKRYQLPKFSIALKTNKILFRPKDKFIGRVDCNYIFGKPVKNAMAIVKLSNYFDSDKNLPKKINGKTNEKGIFQFETLIENYFLKDKKNSLVVNIEVIDEGGQKQKKIYTYKISDSPFVVELFSESDVLSSGMLNKFYLLTYNPDGTPIEATASVWGKELRTSPQGYSEFELIPYSKVENLEVNDHYYNRIAKLEACYKNDIEIKVEAKDDLGNKVNKTFKFHIENDHDIFLFNTEKSTYKTSETLDINIKSDRENGTYLISLIRDNQCIYLDTFTINDKNGKITLDLTPDLSGTLLIQLRRFNNKANNFIYRSKLINVIPDNDLNISVKKNMNQYLPGESAKLDISVTSQDSKPIQSAISISIVDKAVFALAGTHSEKERLFFILHHELLKSKYDKYKNFSNNGKYKVLNRKLKNCIYDEYRRKRWEGYCATSQWSYMSYFCTMEEINGFLKCCLYISPIIILYLLFFSKLINDLIYFVKSDKFSALKEEEIKRLRALKNLFVTSIMVPFGYLVTYSLILIYNNIIYKSFPLELYIEYCIREFHGKNFLIGIVFINIVISVVWMLYLSTITQNDLLKKVFLYSFLFYISSVAFSFGSFAIMSMDFIHQGLFHYMYQGYFLAIALTLLTIYVIFLSWFYVKLSNRNNINASLRWFKAKAILLTLLLTITLIGIALLSYLHSFSFLSGGGRGGGPLSVDRKSMKTRSSSLYTSKVRRYFPETLYWAPEVITDTNGKYTLELPLADSITTWTMSTNAISANGAQGSASTNIKVFQDFFIDINLPSQLNDGDRISIPVSIYNYHQTKQTVELKLEKADWFTVVGFNNKINIAPDSVSKTYVEIDVNKSGKHKLLVKAKGTTFQDAVERHIEVVPNGCKHVKTKNSFLENSINIAPQIPDNAIPVTGRFD